MRIECWEFWFGEGEYEGLVKGCENDNIVKETCDRKEKENSNEDDKSLTHLNNMRLVSDLIS